MENKDTEDLEPIEEEVYYGSDKNEIREEEQPDNITAIYYCPKHCEGDKTYNEPGNCPVCNMLLLKTDD